MSVSVTTAMVRTQIADQPQWYPALAPPANAPDLIGIGDGTATVFGLAYATSIAASLTVYTAPAPAAGLAPTWTAANPASYTVGTNGVITFGTAPAAGVQIGARYQATAFTDADLTNYITNATTVYGTDNRTLLKAVHFDLIDVILSDQRRLTILAEGSGYRNDPGTYANNLRALKESLRKDLSGGPLPGSDVPALSVGIGVAAAGRYLPRR